MLSLLIAEAMDTAGGVKENVNIDGLKTIYNLLWDNPNLNKRKKFRAKMTELKDEDAWGGAQRALKHLDEMANLIGIEIIVMSHGPRGDRQPDAGWQLPKTKKKNKETQDKAKEKEKEKTKAEGRKPGGGEKGEGRGQAGKALKGKGGEGRAAASAEPQWEDGALDQAEWDTPLLLQEGVVPDGKGVALCSRKVFLEKVDYWVSNTKLAVVLPGGKEWFQTKDLTKAAADRLNAAKVVQFTYQYHDTGGQETRTPKQGLLVQLGAVRVKQIFPEVHKVEIQEYTELTLNIYKEAVPPEVWKIAAANKDKFFNDSLGRLLGEPPTIFKKITPYFRGEECIQTTIKILPGYVEKVLINSDKHHLFSRLTLRNGVIDDGYEKLWLPRTKDLSLTQETRLYREKAMRLVGEDFKGIAFRGRGDDGRGRAQVGLRVNLGVVDRVRHHFLREDQLPIPEARGVKQKMLWTLRGVPANFEARTLAKALLQHMKWTVVALKELSRPSAPAATWLVSSDVEPPNPKWWINTGTGRLTLVTINAKTDGGKAGGRKGNEEVVLREGRGAAKGRPRATGGEGGKGQSSRSDHPSHQSPAWFQPQSDDGGGKRRRPTATDDDAGDGGGHEQFAEIYSIGEDDPINVDDIYVNTDNDSGIVGVRRPAFLPQAEEGGSVAQDGHG